MGFVVGSHCRCAAVPARKAGPGRPQEALDNPTTTKANFNLVTPDRPSLIFPTFDGHAKKAIMALMEVCHGSQGIHSV